MPSFADLKRFIGGLEAARTGEALAALLARITPAIGFDRYAVIHHAGLAPMRADLSHLDGGELLALTDFPAGWIEARASDEAVASDPILRASGRANVGFLWSDVAGLRADAHCCLAQGYTVPANIPGEPNGSCSFALNTSRDIDEESQLMAQMIGPFAFQAARAIFLKAHQSREQAPALSLSGRQLECLILVARGKSDWEIAHILGIGQETVKHHVRMAREHYGVPTRVQAAVRAIFERQITASDLFQ